MPTGKMEVVRKGEAAEFFCHSNSRDRVCQELWALSVSKVPKQ